MPGYNGSGTYQRFRSWEADAAAGVKIRADYHDDEDDGFAAGLSNAICRDGQSTITQNIPFNAKKITNLGAPVNPTDAATKQYVDSVRNFSSAISITGSTPESLIKFTGATGPYGLSFPGPLFFGANATNWIWSNDTNGVTTANHRMILAASGAGLTLQSPASVSVSLVLAGSPAASIFGRNTTLPRWGVFMGDGSAEGGSNSGNNFIIVRYSDAGASLGNVFSFLRNTGECVVYSTVASSSATTGALSVRGGMGVAGGIYCTSLSTYAAGLNVVDGNFQSFGGTVLHDTAGTFVWHAAASAAVIDYGGPAASYGLTISNRLTGGASTAVLFKWSSASVGTITVTASATAYNTTSDRRTKTGLAKADNARAIIDALEVVEYTPITDEPIAFPAVEGTEPPADIPAFVSIPAQQAYTVYPQAVTPPDTAMAGYKADAKFGEEGFMPWMIDHSKFVPSLIANTQENNSRLDALEARLAQLEAA